jgi:hypothetical protein
MYVKAAAKKQFLQRPNVRFVGSLSDFKISQRNLSQISSHLKCIDELHKRRGLPGICLVQFREGEFWSNWIESSSDMDVEPDLWQRLNDRYSEIQRWANKSKLSAEIVYGPNLEECEAVLQDASYQQVCTYVSALIWYSLPPRSLQRTPLLHPVICSLTTLARARTRRTW